MELKEFFKKLSNPGYKLKFIANIISWIVLIPGLILFFIILSDEQIASAFIALLCFWALSMFFSAIPEALGEIVLQLQKISENTDPNKKTIIKKTIKYRCKKCGNIIDSLPCPICSKSTSENNVTVIDNVFCEHCGADISNDIDTCHVCGEKI